MDYEKKYKEALERARKWYNDSHITIGLKGNLKDIFPELAEPKDEKIRKEIKVILANTDFSQFALDYTFADMINWLEKQKEHNSFFKEIEHDDCLEVNNTKPKFHEGDWVVYNNDICKIVKREEGCNILVTQFGIEKEPVNERNLSTAKLWDISCAKDGDVLVTVDGERPFIYKGCLDTKHPDSPVAYCGINADGYFHSCSNKFNHWWTEVKVHPATKEQKDALFVAMKDAGYEWDAERKKSKLLISNGGDFLPEVKESEDDNINEETNAPTEYGKYIDECLNKAAKHFFSEGEDKYSVADLFYFGVRCGQSCFEKQGREDYNPYKVIIKSIAELCERYSRTKDWKDFYDNVIVKCKDAIEYDKANSEKQGEQKPIDKAEPMFKVGNWYQCIKDFFGKGVTFNKNTAYYCAKEGCLQNEYGCHIAIVKDLYDNFKLWTLDNAKDGDILAFQDEYIFIYNNTSILQAYCYYHTKDDKFCIEDRTHHHKWVMSEVKPATKEQCNLLFSKIKESGHEWLEETHELKKIEQKSQRMISAEAKEALYDKSAWSEEDERLYRGLQDLIYSTPYCNSRKKISDWLKSLKDRCTWKPSEGQMEAMENLIINIIRNPLLLDNYTQSNIRSLCNDLRKLVIIR